MSEAALARHRPAEDDAAPREAGEVVEEGGLELRRDVFADLEAESLRRSALERPRQIGGDDPIEDRQLAEVARPFDALDVEALRRQRGAVVPEAAAVVSDRELARERGLKMRAQALAGDVLAGGFVAIPDAGGLYGSRHRAHVDVRVEVGYSDRRILVLLDFPHEPIVRFGQQARQERAKSLHRQLLSFDALDQSLHPFGRGGVDSELDEFPAGREIDHREGDVLGLVDSEEHHHGSAFAVSHQLDVDAAL